MRWRVSKIISGGQIGADTGGLLAARDLGIETGGVAPKGWFTEEGPMPALLQSFGLIECEQPGYPARTRLNVLQSDATLLVGPYASGGSALTSQFANEMQKPLFHAHYPAPAASQVEEFYEWILTHQVRILNVAGNRESMNPGICEFTRSFLAAAFNPRQSP